jgi:hypothetical protein
LFRKKNVDKFLLKGRVVDPDPDWIGFSDFVDPDPYWESGFRIRIQGQENKEISVEKCTFYFFIFLNFPVKRC